MGEVITEFFRLVNDLSLKKVIGAIVCLVIVLGGFWVFDRQTSWLEFSRLERAQHLLTEIAAVERGGPLDAETLGLQRQLKEQLKHLLGEPGPAVATTNPPSQLRRYSWTFVAGAAPWTLAIILLLLAPKKPAAFPSAIIGLSILATFSGVLTALIPARNALTAYFFVPLFIFSMTGGLGAFASAAANVKKKAEDNAIRNNLRQLLAAFSQFALENGVTEARFDEIVGPSKYLKQVTSVAGEDYTALPLKVGATLWRVTTKDGRAVEMAI